jgi:hypothetical protein
MNLQNINELTIKTDLSVLNGVKYVKDGKSILVDLSLYTVSSLKNMNDLLETLSNLEEYKNRIKFTAIHHSIISLSRILGLSYLFIQEGFSHENNLNIKAA